MPNPEPGDFVTVKPGSGFFDIQTLESYGEIKVLQTEECSAKNDDACNYKDPHCCLFKLNLEKSHPCYDSWICYIEKWIELRQVSIEEKELQDIILVEEKKNIVKYQGQDHEIIEEETFEIDDDINDLIL